MKPDKNRLLLYVFVFCFARLHSYSPVLTMITVSCKKGIHRTKTASEDE